jgi:hypothetical protein
MPTPKQKKLDTRAAFSYTAGLDLKMVFNFNFVHWREGMMKERLSGWARVVLVLVLPSLVWASDGAGSVRGVVLDQAGIAIAGAQVRLFAGNGAELSGARTDQRGMFAFEKLPSANYVIVVSKGGFREAKREVELVSGQTISTEFKLESGASTADERLSSAALAEIEQLRGEVERLRALVSELMRERGSASLAAAAKAESQQTQRQEKAGQESQEKPLPGRGKTEQGLYGSVAAGGRGTRYGRSLFGESVRIGGYGSFRFEANDLKSGPRIGNLPVARRAANGFTFRRMVLTADVNPADRLRFYTELEFERFGKIEVERAAIPENRGGINSLPGTRFIQELEGQAGSELKLEQFWMQYNLNNSFAIRGGVILPPLGRFNILHDDDYWDVPRRTLVDRDAPVMPAKVAWSEAGIGLIGSNTLGKGWVNYQFYVVNGVTLDFALEQTLALRGGDKAKVEHEAEISFASGPVNGSRPAQALTWRFGIIPRLGNEIAFSGYHGKYVPGFLRQSAWINSLGIDGKFTRGNFEAEGEFIYTRYGKLQEVLSDLVRNLVSNEFEDELGKTETSIELGLRGPFTNSRRGFWIDAKYRWRPEWLKRSILGESFADPQLIPIIRYERVWFNKFVSGLEFKNALIESFDTENLSQDRITIGLTYRPVASVPISFAYEHNRRRAGQTLIFPITPGLGRASDRSFNAVVIGIALGF